MITSTQFIVKLFVFGINLEKMTTNTLSSFKGSYEDRCPCCGKKDLEFHKSYTRTVTNIRNGNIETVLINTKRYKCTCGKTHVVLPALIVPYCHFSLAFMIWVLYEYFTKADTVVRICEKYDISVPTLYRWIKAFNRDKEIWLKRLRNAETSAQKFLEYLKSELNLGIKLREFAQSISPHRQFFQTHRHANIHLYV